MNLRQQLQLSRALRNLRTWAPPISMGVIIAAGMFIFSDYLDRPHDTAQVVALQTAEPTAPAEIHYRNCRDARAAGAAPLHRGDPGYASRLDRDNDGVACEPMR